MERIDSERQDNRSSMKVFVVMPDSMLLDEGDLPGELVPFNPEFLVRRRQPGEGHKPKNWISDCNPEQARARLHAAI